MCGNCQMIQQVPGPSSHIDGHIVTGLPTCWFALLCGVCKHWPAVHTSSCHTPDIASASLMDIESNPEAVMDSCLSEACHNTQLLIQCLLSQSPPALPQIEQGKAIIDACKTGGADFIVFCSVMACDTAPAAAKHIRHVGGMIRGKGETQI